MKLIMILIFCASCASFKGPSLKVVDRKGRLTPEETREKIKRRNNALVVTAIFFAGIGLISLDK